AMDSYAISGVAVSSRICMGTQEMGRMLMVRVILFFFQEEDGIRYAAYSRGLGDVYKRQL
ncbi:hypothetical protein, partial [Escherichia coli]|uniref:hypothetical protein n=1 Tax=Escherichia coli TaxID=562 RepID=UPI0019D4B4AA